MTKGDDDTSMTKGNILRMTQEKNIIPLGDKKINILTLQMNDF